jgi:S1-C subfamily serine protease
MKQIAQYLKSNVKEGAVVFSVERRSPADKNGMSQEISILKG